MKVFHINDKISVSGGVEVSIRDVLPELHARGIESYWIAMRRQETEVEIISNDAAWNWRGPIAELSRSPLAAAVGGETILHVHSLSEPAILDQLFGLAPVVRHMHDQRMFCPGQGKFWAKSETICTSPSGPHCLYHAYTQHCCNRHPSRLLQQIANTRFEMNEASCRYAKIIANSQHIRREALQVGFPEDRLLVINYFTEVTPEPDWRAPQPPVIVFAGRLSRTKGVHVLLDAFARVLRNIPEAKLEVLGSGHDEQAFFRQADQLDLGPSVHFLGWADKATIDAHLRKAAVVAYPSIYPEAFGITGIEAMMRGRAVVAFDVGGIQEWLRHGETGYALKPINAETLAVGLREILLYPALREKMGRAARKNALRLFSAPVHVSALIKAYESAMQ
ncbi:MAG: glycosyltransferase family 4 protein [Parvularcula sp.]|jgi:glycosyltransferase involved in cell wall biosynthesis|nr:glycosyltransferase family 4 protein [Parvularcula sp.]